MTRAMGAEDHTTEAPWWIKQQCDLPLGPVSLTIYIGASPCGPAHAALFDAIRHIECEAVFVAGPGATASAVWAAQSGAGVVTWNDSVAEHLSVVDTFRENGFARLDAHVATGFSDLIPRSADLALLHLPRGREIQVQLLRACAAILRPGGTLALVGAKNEGVKAAVDEANRVFGLAGVVSHKAGYHAALATAGTAMSPMTEAESPIAAMPDVPFCARRIEVDGREVILDSCDGVFAGDRLDVGATALIRAMHVDPGETVLDLGCGTGLVGLAALRRSAAVIATDVSARAVASTRRTHAANGFPDTAVHLCIGASALPAASVDVVLANPPFHRGHDVDYGVSKLFVEEAARVLKPGGRLYLVANTFLDYRPWLQRRLRSVTTVQEDRHFRVWSAHR